jgi:hypothetical protein
MILPFLLDEGGRDSLCFVRKKVATAVLNFPILPFNKEACPHRRN